MYELIKGSLQYYAFAAAFTGLCVLSAVYATFKNTRNIENKKLKTILRFSISSVLICFWTWFFLCVNLYPISLAYYEYNHNFTEEKVGVIDSIEQNGKDRIYLIIDNAEYTLVDSSESPAVIIGRDIDEGDAVKFKFGVKSKYIFEIYELNSTE